MSSLTQFIAVTDMNIRNLPQRIGTSLVVVIGVAGVVAVLISVLAMATGFSHTVASTARNDRVLIFRGGSQSELSSSLSRRAAAVIIDSPGIRVENSQPLASAEAIVMVNVPKKGDKDGANVALRGVNPVAFAVRPEIKLISGRMFQPGLDELIVGKAAQIQFQGLEVGKKIAIRGTEWSIVGNFTSGGDTHESEMLADVEAVITAYRREGYQAVTALVDDFTKLKDTLTSNPELGIEVVREPDYYRDQSRQVDAILFFVAYVVGGIMAIGAIFAALNTMYAAVSARTLEIATLRAIGFGPLPIVASILSESLFLSLLGGLLGAAVAWVVFNGNAVSTLGSNFTQIVFPISVDARVLVTGLIWAAVVGLVGGIFPAIRAARIPVAAALQAQ